MSKSKFLYVFFDIFIYEKKKWVGRDKMSFFYKHDIPYLVLRGYKHEHQMLTGKKKLRSRNYFIYVR